MSAQPTARPRRLRFWRPTPGLITAGIVVLALLIGGGYLAWQYLGTNWAAEAKQRSEIASLRQKWAKQPANFDDAMVAGRPYAILRIPKLGNQEFAVIAGIDDEALARGIATYPSAVQPGEAGNFAIAGYRVTHGEPFRRLLELDKGAEIVIETATAIHTYVLDTRPADLTVDREVGWVLDAVPASPGQQAARPLITLTTSQDLWPSPDRAVAFGHLLSSQNK